MASPQWRLQGEFYGNCSCDALRCPCPTSNFKDTPTHGWCRLAVIFQIDSGHFDNVVLDNCNVVMVADCPSAMADGNWSLGLIFDDDVAPEQQQALGSILGGQVGGPMALFAPWVGKFLGTETRAIEYKKDGFNRYLSVPGIIDVSAEGAVGADGGLVVWDNVMHPANPRVGLARGINTAIHAFGIDFDGQGTQGVLAPFDWQVG